MLACSARKFGSNVHKGHLPRKLHASVENGVAETAGVDRNSLGAEATRPMIISQLDTATLVLTGWERIGAQIRGPQLAETELRV